MQALVPLSSGGVTMANCAIFNAQSKSIAAVVVQLDHFITVGKPTCRHFELILEGGKFTNSGSGQALAAVNKEWFAVQTVGHPRPAAPGTTDLTKMPMGALSILPTNPSAANVFRMSPASWPEASPATLVRQCCRMRTHVLWRDAWSTSTSAIGNRQRRALPKSRIQPASTCTSTTSSRRSVRRSLDDGKILPSRTSESQARYLREQQQPRRFDVDSKTSLQRSSGYEDPAIEVGLKLRTGRKVIKGGDYDGAIDVAGMTRRH